VVQTATCHLTIAGAVRELIRCTTQVAGASTLIYESEKNHGEVILDFRVPFDT
jgi:hypothetical protein